MKKITIYCLLLTGLFLAEIPLFAQQRTVYGIRDASLVTTGESPKLFRFDISDPTNTTDIATFPFADNDFIFAFEARRDNNQFYLLRKNASLDNTIVHTHDYYEVNIQNGALRNKIEITFGTGEYAVDFAWDNSGGSMYVLTVVNGSANGSIRTIDIDGTLGTPISISGMGSIATSATFDNSGNLYVHGDNNIWYSVDMMTGTATSLGNTGVFSESPAQAAHTAFDSGITYMPQWEDIGAFFPNIVSQWYTVDLNSSGTATLVSQLGDGSSNYVTSALTVFDYDFDISAIDIDLNNCSERFAQVTITVENKGLQALTGFEVAYVLNGADAVSETYTGTINAFETAEYTFNTTVDIRGISSYIMDAFVTLGTDQNSFNDALIGKNVTPSASAGGLINESFEGGDVTNPDYLPTGWDKFTIDASGNGWYYTDVTQIGTWPDFGGFFMGGVAGATTLNASRDAFMITQEGGSGSPIKQEDYLFLPPFSTEDYTGLSLMFDYYYEDDAAGGDGPENAKIDISTDGGTTWVELYDIPGSPGGSVTSGTDVHEWVDGHSVPIDASYEGLSDVRIRFHYDDSNGTGLVTASSGLAIDNVNITGTFTGSSDNSVNLSSPLVKEAYVPPGTPHHTIYVLDLDILDKSALTRINDVALRTNGSYRSSDINIQGDTLGFRLWYSPDSILGPGDILLGRNPALKSGSLLVFSCINIALQDKGYIYLTADIAEDAVLNRTIWVEAPDISIQDIDFLSADEVAIGTIIPSERQIIGFPQEVVGNIFMANLFTPNGDGKNDNYTIIGGAIVEDGFAFKIFDRNGALMYETNDLNEAINIGWDGKVNGEDAPNGIYLWSLEGNYLDGRELTYLTKKTGTVRLLR